MSAKAIIIGTGGHSRVISSLLPESYTDIRHSNIDGKGANFRQEELLEKIDEFRNFDFYLAVGDNAARAKLFTLLNEAGVNLPPLIAPNAYISPNAELGRGVFVGVGASIVANARAMDNSIINTNSNLDHDCTLGQNGQISVGVTVAGNCKLGNSSFLGVQSATLPGVTIGEGSIVMAGSLVTKNIEANIIVGGIPARLVRAVA